MTETSYYWEGLITGDASISPYDVYEYHGIWRKLFSKSANQGVLNNYLNQLAVVGIAGGVTVDTGAALVSGWFYNNDSKLTTTITTPVSNPRIDLVVIRMDGVLQTARVAVVTGTEAASPTAPALTQDRDVTWEIPLAQVSITTGGVITVTDTRVNVATKLTETPNFALIEEKIVTAGTFECLFDNVPQTYTHLMIQAGWDNSASSAGQILLNEDLTGTNYWRMLLNAFPGTTISSLGFNSNVAIGGNASTWYLYIPNYTGAFNKMIYQTENNMDGSGGLLNTEFGMWNNNAAITQVRVIPSSAGWVNGVISLYGID